MKTKTIKPAPIVALPLDTDSKTLAAIKSAGYIPVLTDAPDKVRIIVADQACESSDMLMAALFGLCNNSMRDEPRSDFTFELFRRLKAREPKCPPPGK